MRWTCTLISHGAPQHLYDSHWGQPQWCALSYLSWPVFAVLLPQRQPLSPRLGKKCVWSGAGAREGPLLASECLGFVKEAARENWLVLGLLGKGCGGYCSEGLERTLAGTEV